MVERHATFIGLDTGDVDLTAPIPHTSKIGIWRIDPSAVYVLMDDPSPRQAEQAKNNEALHGVQTGRIAFQGRLGHSRRRKPMREIRSHLTYANVMVTLLAPKRYF